MYYNVYEKQGKIYYSYKDENTGKTQLNWVKYKPTVGVLSDYGDYTDIHGNIVKRIEFDNIYEYKKFVKSNRDLCGVIDPKYQFIKEHFKEESVISTPDVWFFDIEVYTKDNFPKPEEAMYSINAFTFYSVVEDHYYTMSMKNYTPKSKQHSYMEAVNEEHLIEMIVKIIQMKNIQIISGWNVLHFDIKYLLNRMRNVYYNKNHIIRDWMDNNINPYNKELYTIQIVDYMEAYKYFAKKIDKYSLDFVSMHELGEGKIKSEYPLWQLFDEHFEKFIDYNIQDVALLSKIDKKMKLMETIMNLSNIMKALPSNVFSSEFLWHSYLYSYLLDKNQMLPYEHHPEREIIGGYVTPKEKLTPGRYFNVVIADLVSSYPHQMMQFNISLETIVKDVPKELHEFRKSIGYGKETYIFVENYLNSLRDADFCQRMLILLQKYNVIMTGNGEFYKKDYKGLIPTVVEQLFNVRSRAKNNANILEKMIHDIKDIIKEKERGN